MGRENIFALIMIGSTVFTMIYLFYGILLELWEGGIITMGSKGIINLVSNGFKNTGALLRRTIRSHWILRSIHNFARKLDAVYADDNDSFDLQKNILKVSHAPPPPRHTAP